MPQTNSVFQLKLTIHGSVPDIWRRVLVPNDLALSDLHYVILYAFCWFDDRPHEFVLGQRAGSARPESTPAKPLDEDAVLLSTVLQSRDEKMRYRCTSGDRWVIDVRFENEHRYAPTFNCPECIDGARDGPPEGVGGVSRYNQVVEAFAQPESWKAMISELGGAQWLEPYFDPAFLDLGIINGLLGLIFPGLEATPPWLASTHELPPLSGPPTGRVLPSS